MILGNLSQFMCLLSSYVLKKYVFIDHTKYLFGQNIVMLSNYNSETLIFQLSVVFFLHLLN